MERHSNKWSCKVIATSEGSHGKVILTSEGSHCKVILTSEGSHGKSF